MMMCSLSQESVFDLDKRDRVPLVRGLCQNPFTKSDGSLGICGRPLGDHPAAGIYVITKYIKYIIIIIIIVIIIIYCLFDIYM